MTASAWSRWWWIPRCRCSTRGRADAASRLPVTFPHLGLDLRHARDPAVVILGLLAHVAEHLRVRQDQEGFLLDAGQCILCYLLRRQIAVAGLRTLRDRAQHIG